MDIKKVIATATPALNASIAAILKAEKEGTPVPKDALRVGGLAALIVEKSQAIIKDPAKFDAADETKAQGQKDMAHANPATVAALVKSGMTKDYADTVARAEGVIRYKQARRSLSQRTKVETMLTAMSTAPARRGRKAKVAAVIS